MFECLGTFPLSGDLFSQAIHPKSPLVAIGLSNGKVEIVQPEEGASIKTLWKTQRHKGSVRSLAFSYDGSSLFSAGTDGIVKVADSTNGQVSAKFAIPDWKEDNPYTLHALSPQNLILGTDMGLLHVYDLRHKLDKPQATHQAHDEYVSSITPLPPSGTSTSGFSKLWVSTGGGTLACTDLRKGVLAKSEEQEVELLSSLHVEGLSKKGSNVGEKVLVGCEDGYIRLFEKGVWDDMDERLSVLANESLDTMCRVPESVSPAGRCVIAVGSGAGDIRFFKIGPNRLLEDETLMHSMEDGVTQVGFDSLGRMISGGGTSVKIWATVEHVDDGEESDEEEEEEDSDSDSDDSDDSDEEEEASRPAKKRKASGLDFGGLD